MWFSAPWLTQPVLACTAWSAGRTRSRRAALPTTASIAARSTSLALGPAILRSIGLDLQPLDTDRRGLELRRAGLGIGRVDREQIRGHVVGEVQRHEREPRAQALIETDGHIDSAPPRTHANDVAVAKAVTVGVLRRYVEGLAATQR